MTQNAVRASNASIVSLWLVIAALLLSACSSLPSDSPAVVSNPIPILSYYYICFDFPSLYRSKTYYPILDRYSIINEYVIRQHIQ